MRALSVWTQGVVWLAALPFAAAAQATTIYSGYEGLAYDLSSGTMLYKETHYIKRVDNVVSERVVLYRCPNNQAFGRKILNVSSGALTPEFSFNDQRTGHSEGLARVANDASKVNVRFQISGKKKLASEAIARTGKMVADAGFDEFIVQNWSALKAGTAVPLDFVVPSQLDYLGFKVKFLRTTVLDKQNASVFRLAPSGLLSLLTSGIDVTYLDADKSLRQFAGLSNIRDLSGENYEVKIDFPLNLRQTYPDAGAFDSARVSALVNRCN
jgi:hypothetical protein